jgi:hypothetical protein
MEARSAVVRKTLTAMVVSESKVDGQVAFCFYSHEQMCHEVWAFNSAPNVCAPPVVLRRIALLRMNVVETFGRLCL